VGNLKAEEKAEEGEEDEVAGKRNWVNHRLISLHHLREILRQLLTLNHVLGL
jgi:hypothetical protein